MERLSRVTGDLTDNKITNVWLCIGGMIGAANTAASISVHQKQRRLRDLLTGADQFPQLSSAPLQVLFYLNSWYFAAFYLAEILMFIYKGVLLPYPSDNLVLDVVLLLLFLALETLRIVYGQKGNLCERSLTSCVSLFVLLPCATLAVYYLLLQTFVLRLEFLLNAMLLCFYALELLLGLLSISAFSRSKVY